MSFPQFSFPKGLSDLEKLASIYGLSRGPGESDEALRARVQLIEGEATWRDKAFRLFGYKILGENNHAAIAKLLQEIDAGLLADGSVTLTITLNPESIANAD